MAERTSTHYHIAPVLPGPPEASPFFEALRQRILHRHEAQGWEGLVKRVIALARRAEEPWKEPDEAAFVDELRRALMRGAFVPNSPLLVHAGEPEPRLFACFALDASRPLEEFLPVARRVHDGMGGVGYSLASFQDAKGAASFLAAVDADTVAWQVGRPRPASSAATVAIDHPAAEAVFAAAGRMLTTNLNVGLSDAFMARVAADDADATRLLDRLAASIHRCGHPGVLFTDRVPKIARESEAVFAANVCGEAPLAADESGLLGSLNLVQLLHLHPDGEFRLDEAALASTTAMAVRFLDGMHDLHHHPSPRVAQNSLATRKIGVGVMGFAHALALLGIAYDSPEAEVMAGRIGRLMMEAAHKESERLASARGAFSASQPTPNSAPRRNACLVAIAGTATIALLVGTTGGIEPIFSHLVRQRVIDRDLVVLDPIVEHFARAQGMEPAGVAVRLGGGEALEEILGAKSARLLPTATAIAGEAHVRVQAAFQRVIDGGITKTVNCAADTRVDQIQDWLVLAWELGCMGLTIYRDGSLPSQPVNAHARVERA